MPNDETTIQTINAAIEKEGLSWTAGPTTLSSLPPEEQRKRLGLIVDPAELQRMASESQRVAAQEQTFGVAAVGAPASVDWRNNGGNYVTPIKDQGGCGSCVSFCTCSVIESAMRIKLQNPNHSIDLSEGFLQFCGGASCSGWGLTSGLDFAKSTGVTDEACMPYTAGGGTNMNCNASRCSDWQNRLTKISSYANHSTMEARKNAIAAGPVLAGMEVWTDFFSYSSGVYVKSAAATPLTPNRGYHCLSVVGYNDAQQCWILKNSWGAGWGESGFVRIKYGQADLLIDSSWMFSSVVVQVQLTWQNNVQVTQVYASRDSQNAWAYFQGLGWRKIQTGAADGVTNMLSLFAQAVAKNKTVTIYADGDFVYQAYL
jgi:C1A family cysteine protease